MTPSETPDPPKAAADAKPTSHDGETQVVCVKFSELAAGGKEVHIEHEDLVYRLLLTKNGKLILNK